MAQLSYVRNPENGQDAVRSLEALWKTIHSYLCEIGLTDWAVLKNIPVFPGTTSPFAFNDAAFTVLTKNTITLDHYAPGSQPVSETPLVVIYGVPESQPTPPFVGQWSLGWLSTEGGGNICLSKKSFLKETLLQRLEAVNRDTTFLLKFSNAAKDAPSGCDLVTWASEQEKTSSLKGKRCDWEQVSDTPSLQYVWSYRDNWTRERDATPRVDGVSRYTLALYTENKLFISIDHRPGRKLELQLTGRSVVEIGANVPSEHPSQQTIVEWEINATIGTDQDGSLRVSALRAPTLEPPHPRMLDVQIATGMSEAFLFDAKLLDNHKVRLEQELDHFVASFPGDLEKHLNLALMNYRPQQLGFVDPMFTRHGDFIVELAALRADALAPSGLPIPPGVSPHPASGGGNLPMKQFPLEPRYGGSQY